MSCTRDFLQWHWQRHAWRRRVTGTESVSVPVTDMWGRPVTQGMVRCHTQYVCDNCGKTCGDSYCLCDPARGERCAVRCDFLEASRHASA